MTGLEFKQQQLLLFAAGLLTDRLCCDCCPAILITIRYFCISLHSQLTTEYEFIKDLECIKSCNCLYVMFFLNNVNSLYSCLFTTKKNQ